MSTSPQPWRMGSRAWFGLLVLGLLLWLVIRHGALIFEVTVVLFVAYLISLAISPIANWLGQRGVPRAVSVLAFYFVAFAVLILVGRALVPVLHMETRHLQRTLPETLDKALTTLRGVPMFSDIVPPSSDVLAREMAGSLDTYLRPAFSALVSASSVVVDLIIVLVLAYFFATDRAIGDRLLYDWIPVTYQARVRRFTAALRFRLTRWVWAQAAVAIYFAVAFSVVLALLRVPFAFTIGLVGGFLEIIPYFGGFVAFGLAVLSALSVNPVLVLWIAILYLVVVETEGHILAPILYGRVTGLHPAAVLVALLIGAKAAGLLGVLFAVPAAVVVATFVDEAQGKLPELQPLTGPVREPTAPPIPQVVSKEERL